MSFISTQEVRYQQRSKYPRVKNHVPQKSRKYYLTITKLETEVVNNPYKKSTDDGFTFREPMMLLVKVRANTYEGLTCYFTHKLEFVRARGLRKGDYYSKLKTDFVSVSDSAIYEPVVFIRVREGDSIWVKGIEDEKVSAKGTYYLKLTRVKITTEC